MKSDLFKGLNNVQSGERLIDVLIKRDSVILASDTEVFGFVNTIWVRPYVALFMLGISYIHRNDGDNYVLSLDEAMSDLGSLFMSLNIFDGEDDLSEALLGASRAISNYYNDGFVFIVNPDWSKGEGE